MDVLGSVRPVSDDAGMMLTEGFGGGRQDYTAFGEPFVIMSDGSYQPNWYSLPTRYGFAGAWGYERLMNLGGDYTQTLHLGERFYNPGLGRFLQRDPIGIRGGLNVYAYVCNSPLLRVDPAGLLFFETLAGAIGGAISGAVSGFIIGGPAGAAAGAIAGGIAGAVTGFIGDIGTRGGLSVKGAFVGGILLIFVYPK